MKKAFFIVAIAMAVNSVAFGDTEKQQDSNVEVVWQSPEDYTDVRPANQSRKRFMEQTFNRLEKHFTKLAKRLPEDYQWQLTVTDLDLAGQVWPASFVGFGQGGQDVRLIKDIDIPRMTFSYQLISDGKTLKQADVELKDMGFLHKSLRGSDSDPLRYEKRMLNEWFAEEFADQIIAKK